MKLFRKATTGVRTHEQGRGAEGVEAAGVRDAEQDEAQDADAAAEDGDQARAPDVEDGPHGHGPEVHGEQAQRVDERQAVLLGPARALRRLCAGREVDGLGARCVLWQRDVTAWRSQVPCMPHGVKTGHHE